MAQRQLTDEFPKMTHLPALLHLGLFLCEINSLVNLQGSSHFNQLWTLTAEEFIAQHCISLCTYQTLLFLLAKSFHSIKAAPHLPPDTLISLLIAHLNFIPTLFLLSPKHAHLPFLHPQNLFSLSS